jgi:hypothetical protein
LLLIMIYLFGFVIDIGIGGWYLLFALLQLGIQLWYFNGFVFELIIYILYLNKQSLNLFFMITLLVALFLQFKIKNIAINFIIKRFNNNILLFNHIFIFSQFII